MNQVNQPNRPVQVAQLEEEKAKIEAHIESLEQQIRILERERREIINYLNLNHKQNEGSNVTE